MTTLNLGFIGAPMAGHLRAAAYTLYVHTRNKIPDALRDVGAISCVGAAEVAQQADIMRERWVLPCRKRQVRRSS